MSEAAGKAIVVVGAGPAGLMAAETLAACGHRVVVYDRMAAPARKFLLAGRGGLNLTHSESLEHFLERYGESRSLVEAPIRGWSPDDAVAWCEGLGQPTFTGSSGRIFPKSLKASPLLRAWLERLGGMGVELRRGYRWTGWSAGGAAIFETAEGGRVEIEAPAMMLALGGASWPRLGSDGSWVAVLEAAGVSVSPLVPSNAGVAIRWSAVFAERFAGHPLKRIALASGADRVRGEAVITRGGLEGGAVYALNAAIRNALAREGGGPVPISIDLRPDLDVAEVARRLAVPRGKQSVATYLRKTLALAPVDIGLLREATGNALPAEIEALARLVKGVRLEVDGFAGLARAISTAGGIRRESIDADFMLRARAGVFVAGEMIDWDAPTGGYLLQATLATAVQAARGVERWLARASSP